jgi:hypothetical protein
MFLYSGAKGLPAQCGYVLSIGPVEILAAPVLCNLRLPAGDREPKHERSRARTRLRVPTPGPPV